MGKVKHMGQADDVGRKGKQRRFEDIVLLLPDGEYGSGEKGTRESRGRTEQDYEINKGNRWDCPDGKAD